MTTWRTWRADIDRWAQQRFAEAIAPVYHRWYRDASQAWRRAGLPGVQQFLGDSAPRITQSMAVFLENITHQTTWAWANSWAHHVQNHYGPRRLRRIQAQSDPPPTLAVPVTGIPPVTLGIAEDVAERLKNLPDAWGLTYSQRIWNQTQDVQRQLGEHLRVLLERSEDFQDVARDLRQFQINDARLPRHMQRLDHLGRQMLQRVPQARDAWNKALDEARAYVAERADGPLGTRGFQRTTLQRLNKAIRDGNAAAFDEAIRYWLERRAQYRSLVLVRSTVNRAAQETALRTYQQYDYVQAVRWRLSAVHRHRDECDLKARADIGLGPGVYFKSNVPWPDHPNGRCYLDAVFFTEEELQELHPPVPGNPQAYDAIMQQLTGDAARQANRLGRQQQADAFDRLVQAIPRVQPVYGRKTLTPPPPHALPALPAPQLPGLKERITQHLTAIPEASRTEATYREVGQMVAEEMVQRGMTSAVTMEEHRQLIDRIATLERQLDATPPHEPIVEQLLDEIFASRRLRNEAEQIIQYTTRADHYAILKELRSMGGVWTFAVNSPPDAVTFLRDALDDIPTAWIEAVRPERLYVAQTSRGFYRHDPQLPTIGMTSQNQAVAYHELGHRFEYYATVRDLEAAFHARRTAGEQLENVSPWAPTPELGRPDKYILPYVGREYGGRAYEIVSVGLESVFTGSYPIWLDQEHYTFLLGVLAAL